MKILPNKIRRVSSWSCFILILSILFVQIANAQLTSIEAGEGITYGKTANGTLYRWGLIPNKGIHLRPLRYGTLKYWGEISAGHYNLGINNGKIYVLDPLGSVSFDGEVCCQDKWIRVSARGYSTFDATLIGLALDDNGYISYVTNYPSPHEPHYAFTSSRVNTSDHDWAKISAGHDHFLAIKKDGTLYSWGHNEYGQLGNGTHGTTTQSLYDLKPEKVGEFSDWVAVAAGDGYSLALRGNGRLYAWGRNDNGQLGYGQKNQKQEDNPLSILPQYSWLSICADVHSAALLSDQSLWVWGPNQRGQLGQGNITTLWTPTQVGSDKNWDFVTVGDKYTSALKNNQLCGAGLNHVGQLGTGYKNSLPDYITSFDCEPHYVPPEFTFCPGNMTFETDPGQSMAIGNYNHDATATGSPSPTLKFKFSGATNNAGIGSGSGNHFNVGETTVTLTATNGVSPDAECIFTVWVVDVEGPVITCPDDITTNSPSQPPSPQNPSPDMSLPIFPCTEVVTYAAPVVKDNCSGVTWKQTAGLASGDKYPIGVTTNTFVATDASNNTATCSCRVTVEDRTPPVLSNLPSDITVNSPSTACGQEAKWTGPSASENCSQPITFTLPPLTSQPGAIFPVGTTAVTYKAKDAANNESSCSFNVIVKDVTPPVVKCRRNIDATFAPDALGNPVVDLKADDLIEKASTDNCGFDFLKYPPLIQPNKFDCRQAGTEQKVVLTLMDKNGNPSSCESKVIIPEAPEIMEILVGGLTNPTHDANKAHIYLGYNPPTVSAAVDARSKGGRTGLTYSWSPSTNLNQSNTANVQFTAPAAGTYRYTVSVKNSTGCAATAVQEFCVSDVRVPYAVDGYNDGVFICHQDANLPGGSTTAVRLSNAISHMKLHSNDRLGKCDQVFCVGAQSRMIQHNSAGKVSGDELKVYPNPNDGSFFIELPYFENQVLLTITDMQGRVVASKSLSQYDGTKVRFNLGEVAKGMYMVEVNYSDRRLREKLIIR